MPAAAIRTSPGWLVLEGPLFMDSFHYWGLVIPSEYDRIEELLDRVGAPPF